jgi:Gram-negative bacterial TonB protein C-terminal
VEICEGSVAEIRRDTAAFPVLQSPMRNRSLLLLLCLAASPLLAQDNPAALPTVTAFECPKYPSKAESMRLQGMVKMQITTDGHAVSDVKLISGHPALAPDAIKNVRTWKFADHTPTSFTVDYYYALEEHYKRNKDAKCDAKLDLPTKVYVSTKMPAF